MFQGSLAFHSSYHSQVHIFSRTQTIVATTCHHILTNHSLMAKTLRFSPTALWPLVVPERGL
jgi:hypothetical protein